MKVCQILMAIGSRIEKSEGKQWTQRTSLLTLLIKGEKPPFAHTLTHNGFSSRTLWLMKCQEAF